MFLVLGQPRSGTTLVAQCLNVHTDLVIPDETDVVVPLAFLVDRVRDPVVGRELATTLVTNTARFPASLGEYLDADRVRAAIAAAPWTLNGVLSALYAAMAEAGGGRLGGDKSPNDLKFLRILLSAELFDADLPVIHVVRDVRDVLVSFRELGWAQGLPEGLARFWVANNLMVATNVPRRGSPYLLVRYEDLVADPEGELRRICALLDVVFDPAMTEASRRSEQFQGHVGMAQHARTYEPIDESRVGRFVDELDADTVARVTHLAADGLRAFGYPE